MFWDHFLNVGLVSSLQINLANCSRFAWDHFFGRGRAGDFILFPFYKADFLLVSSYDPGLKYIPRIWKSLSMINAHGKTVQFCFYICSAGTTYRNPSSYHARQGRRFEKSKILDEKKCFVVFSVHECALESVWQLFHKLGMKIKRFQTNFLKIDLLVTEINRSTS